MSSGSNRVQRAPEQQEAPSWAFTLYSEERPEFYIHDNLHKNLDGNQQFTITVKRRSDSLSALDYVKIWLLEWDDKAGAAGGFVKTRQTKLYGSKKKRWCDRKSITFDDLEMISPGVFRIQVEIYRHRGGTLNDALLETLISNDIEFPEIEADENQEIQEI
ncbi:hypothetical protein F5B19DRAFT_458105 [Rostrohypoxylon terebratum]|nr:hypothetical protein F5B19DRAFT_458105 [Rostrohypoxylon terebratum]